MGLILDKSVSMVRGTVSSITDTIGFFKDAVVDDLLKECLKMQEFSHPNVLTLIGVCLDGGPAPYIVMPFMASGCLLAYLRKKRKSLVLDSASGLELRDIVSL